jgi:hypothetical protein
MKVPAFFATTLAAAALVLAPVGAAQAQDGGLSLELNNATAVEGGGCRLTFVAVNDADQDVAEVIYELVFFDAEGRAGLAPNFKFDGLTVGKTRIVSFNLGDLSCADISRIVVNKAVSCDLASGETGDFCISGLATQTRTNIGFTL